MATHFVIPFRFSTISGKVAASVNEEDSYAEVFDSVATIVRYTKGFIEEEPDFGITDQTFFPRFNENLLRSELTDQEPRASQLIDVYPDKFDELIAHVQVQVFGADSVA